MSQTACTTPDTRAWYQHRMMLMVVGIPLLSVVVSFSFLAIAIYTFDGVVVDDYYKQGKEINRVLQRDQTAAELGLQAEITFSAAAVNVALSSNQAIDWPDSLVLSVLHPTQDGRDVSIQLMSTESALTAASAQGKPGQKRYHGKAVIIEPGEWFLQLGTPVWRLSQRIRLMGEQTVRVNP